MTILNIQADVIGQSGIVPKFIYIDTNNTVGQVTGTGFLNGAVEQGLSISESQMALVVTRPSPSSPVAQTGLYNIVRSGENWNLVPISAGSSAGWLLTGNSPGAPAILGTLDNQPISFRANNDTYMTFDVATQRLDISADNFQVAATGFASMAGNTADVDAVTAVGLGALAATQVLIGNNVVPTNSVEIHAPVVTLENIPAGVEADALYYDSVSKEISFGPAGGGGSGWNLTGTNSGAGLKFGTNTADGWQYVVNNIFFGNVTASGDVSFGFGFNVTGPTTIQLETTNAPINIFAAGGTLELKGGSPVDPGPVPPDSIKVVANGHVAGGGYTGVTWTAFGGNLNLDANAGDAQVTASANLQLNGGAQTDLQSGGALNASGQGLVTVASITNNVVLQATAGEVELNANAGAVNVPGLANVVTPAIIHYNTANGRLTYGSAAALQVVVQTFMTPGAYTYTPSPGMKYCNVEVQGAGGSGASPNFPQAGNSGGAGAYARKVFDAATIGVSQSITVGAGGAAATGANGNAGGATDFGALINCTGGAGGVGSGGAGGPGGTATGGDLNAFGGQGSGSMAVTTPTGTSYIVGVGGPAVYDTTLSFNASVDAAGAPGALGAGGTGSINVTADVASGAGGNGFVIVTEYI